MALVGRRRWQVNDVNAKVIPVETVPEIRGGGMKESSGEGLNSSMIYLMHCKNLCKCHNVHLPSTTIKVKKKRNV
jgi:hypothetical protein